MPHLGRPDHKSLRFRFPSRWGFHSLVWVFGGLALLGGHPVTREATHVTVHLVGFYFGWFLVGAPLVARGENFLGRHARPAGGVV